MFWESLITPITVRGVLQRAIPSLRALRTSQSSSAASSSSSSTMSRSRVWYTRRLARQCRLWKQGHEQNFCARDDCEGKYWCSNAKRSPFLFSAIPGEEGDGAHDDGHDACQECGDHQEGAHWATGAFHAQPPHRGSDANAHAPAPPRRPCFALLITWGIQIY